MRLPSGAWVEFERHAAHRRFPRLTIHIGTIWASKADRDAGKPGVRWDETIAWSGPNSDPGTYVLGVFDRRVATALTPPPPGHSHFCADVIPNISDAPDTHGNLAHPSMAALKEKP
jgi:hypothetical protein